MSIIDYDSNGHLCLEQIDLLEFCTKVPTPFYIYSTREIKDNCTRILDHGSGYSFLPCYALKANYNPAILKLIRSLGFGADVVSGGELQFALKSGFLAENVVFAGVGKSEDEIDFAIRSGIHSLNVEGESELHTVGKIAEKLKKRVTIAVRINPDIDAETHPYISTGLNENKFGVDPDTGQRLFSEAARNPWLVPAGIHIHLGSQISSADPYLEAVNFIKDLRERLRQKDIHIQFADLGGGIGLHYEDQLDSNNFPRTYIDKLLPRYLEPLKNSGMQIIVEFGRAVVGSSGLLVSRVRYKKQTPHKTFAIIDAAMNNLIRPSLYQAYHQIVPLKRNDSERQIVDVVGPVCETGDYFARKRDLPVLQEGEFIAVTGAGAYGQVLSSNYNLRPRIAEYLVDGINVSQIYKGETVQDLMQPFKW